MDFQLVMVGAFALLALLLLVAVFQLQDRPGEPPARRAFQAMFVLHFALFCVLIASFGISGDWLMEVLVDGALAGMYFTMALGVLRRSRVGFPPAIVLGASLLYFVADVALDGLPGARVGVAYIAAINVLCAALVCRRPRGANLGDVFMAGIFAGWAAINAGVLFLTFRPGSGSPTEHDVVAQLLALSPAFFAGFGVFLVVSYMIDGQRDLIALSHTDPLTGLHNRRYLVERARGVFMPRRADEPVSLVELDIDHFKTINDRHGHHCGDVALRAVAQVLRDQTRAEEVAARIGGEEFVVLLQGTGSADAAALAERIRKAIEGIRIDHKGRAFALTASFGVATARTGDTSFEALLRETDDALYRAKAAGRNRIARSDLTPARPRAAPSAA